jgi:hypothetical protein
MAGGICEKCAKAITEADMEGRTSLTDEVKTGSIEWVFQWDGGTAAWSGSAKSESGDHNGGKVAELRETIKGALNERIRVYDGESCWTWFQ